MKSLYTSRVSNRLSGEGSQFVLVWISQCSDLWTSTPLLPAMSAAPALVLIRLRSVWQRNRARRRRSISLPLAAPSISAFLTSVRLRRWCGRSCRRLPALLATSTRLVVPLSDRLVGPFFTSAPIEVASRFRRRRNRRCRLSRFLAAASWLTVQLYWPIPGSACAILTSAFPFAGRSLVDRRGCDSRLNRSAARFTTPVIPAVPLDTAQTIARRDIRRLRCTAISRAGDAPTPTIIAIVSNGARRLLGWNDYR